MGKYGNTILTHVEKGTYTKRLIYQKGQHTKSSMVVIKLYKIYRQKSSSYLHGLFCISGLKGDR